MLFEKDYSLETPEIKAELKRHEESKERIVCPDGEILVLERFSLANRHSLDYYKHISLFPNHNLMDPSFENRYPYKVSLSRFIELVENVSTLERDILNFIRDERAYFIVASLLKKYNFGHHGIYFFREFPLGISCAVDFLIIGKSSDGYKLIFVELENVYGRVTNDNGDLGEIFRKGLSQIEDWKSWLDSNYGSLKEVFYKLKGKYEDLPRELIEYDSTRMNFVVVGGRRSDFKDKTYTNRRRLEKNGIKLLHYDNLIDYSSDLLNSGAY